MNKIMLISGREVINEPNYFIAAAIFIIGVAFVSWIVLSGRAKGANNAIFR